MVLLTVVLWVLANFELASLCPFVPAQKIKHFFRFESVESLLLKFNSCVPVKKVVTLADFELASPCPRVPGKKLLPFTDFYLCPRVPDKNVMGFGRF